MVVFPPCISAENKALHDSTSAILQKQQGSLVVRETIPRRFQWSSSQMLKYDFTTVSYSDKKKNLCAVSNAQLEESQSLRYTVL